MSVDFRAGVILGWKLTKERYNELPDNIIEDYDWVCQFCEPRQRKEEYKLLDLELIDENENLIKKYK